MKPNPITLSTFTIVIIDDEQHGIDEVESIVHQVPGMIHINSFANTQDAIMFLHDFGKVDLILSDIEMPDLDGIQSAPLLKPYCRYLIFVTAYREYALDAIGVQPDGYIMKPVSYIDFAQQITKLRLRDNDQRGPIDNFIFVKGDRKNSFHKVILDEIIYIEGMLNYVRIHTAKIIKLTYSLLHNIESELAGTNKFFRISKSIIISVDHLENVEGNEAYMSNNMSFTVGQPYRAGFSNFLRSRSNGKNRRG